MSKSKSRDRIPLSIEWYVPDELTPRYATNMVVQRMEHEILISFFETQPPIVLGGPDEVSKKLTEIGSIRANCVAQIMVSAEKMPDFIDALQSTLKKAAKLASDSEEVE